MRSASTLLAPVLLPAVVAAGLVVAPSASAECVSSSGTTICSQGSVRGSDTGQGPGLSGPAVPYPCEYDWYCYDNENVGIILGAGDGDIGRPGTPGNRPEVTPHRGNSRPSGGRGRR